MINTYDKYIYFRVNQLFLIFFLSTEIDIGNSKVDLLDCFHGQPDILISN